jgi:hypothetical protein
MRVPVRGPVGGQPQEPSISAARRARVSFSRRASAPLGRTFVSPPRVEGRVFLDGGALSRRAVHV